jgi:hypothetical protein
MVIGKHRELLIDMLLYYLNNMESDHTIMKQNLINNIKAQDSDGKWYTKYYIDEFIY